MDESVWLARTVLDAIHHDQLQRHGGRSGIKDANVLESALARARHKWAYQAGVDVFVLAAAYGFGLATNHGYVDGNKRVAFMAMYTFLGVNGWEIVAPEPEVVRLMLEITTRERGERELGEWLRQHTETFVG